MSSDPAGRDRDLYAILGVAPEASAADITSAYRRLVRELHPDANPDPAAKERFRDVSAAYEVLHDGARRAAYDRARRNAARAARRRPGGGYSIPVDYRDRVVVDRRGIFGQQGRDLSLTVPVTFTEATLGALISIPTLRGGRPVSLRIPPGTSTGRVFRVRGHGAPSAHGTGDLLVTVQVHVPKQLTPDQRSLLERLAQIEDRRALRAHLDVDGGPGPGPSPGPGTTA